MRRTEKLLTQQRYRTEAETHVLANTAQKVKSEGITARAIADREELTTRLFENLYGGAAGPLLYSLKEAGPAATSAAGTYRLLRGWDRAKKQLKALPKPKRLRLLGVRQ